jgi:uncharacterized membrane protein
MKLIKINIIVLFSLLVANNTHSNTNISYNNIQHSSNNVLEIDYISQIQPILSQSCTSCHGNSAGLNLNSYNALMNGSNNGAVITPSNHSTSTLWQRINNNSMPPGNNPDLSSTQINLIAQWIDEGALFEPLPSIDYEIQVQPIFNQNCTSCHGASGGLNLTSYNLVMNGGFSGSVITPSNNITSILWQRIDNGSMPPGNNPELSETQKNIIAHWINEGALAEPFTCAANGDYNFDGFINITDIIASVNIIIGVYNYSECMDMNGDETVNILDILNMVNFILGN